jgi:hypothetical protein
MLFTIFPLGVFAADSENHPKSEKYYYRQLYVLNNNSPIRESYSKNSKAIDKFETGTVLQMHGYIKNNAGNIWYHVTIPSTSEFSDKYYSGWIYSDNVIRVSQDDYYEPLPAIVKKKTAYLYGIPSKSKTTRTLHVTDTIEIVIKVTDEVRKGVWYETKEGDFVNSEDVVLIDYSAFETNSNVNDGIAEVEKAYGVVSTGEEVAEFINTGDTSGIVIDYIIDDLERQLEQDGSTEAQIAANLIEVHKIIAGSPIAKIDGGIGLFGNTAEEISEIQETLSSWQLMKVNNSLRVYNEILIKIQEFPSKVYALGVHDGLINKRKTEHFLDNCDELYNSLFSSFSDQVHERNKSFDVWSWIMNGIPTSQRTKVKEIIKGLDEVLDTIPRENIYDIYYEGFKVGQQAALASNSTTPPVWTPPGTDSSSGNGSASATVTPIAPPETPPTAPPIVPPPKWSDWSEQYIAPSATREVETMVRYRYHTYTCPGCGYHSSSWDINCWNCDVYIPNNWQEKWLSNEELSTILIRYDQGDDKKKGVVVLLNEDWWFYEYSGQLSKTYYRSRTKTSN